jgi:hypothetical protein
MNSLLLNNGGLGLDVDTVKELTDILVLHGAHLVHDGSLAGDDLEVIALKHELVLHLGGIGTVDLHASGDELAADALLTEEVADLDHLALNGDVDGKMGICEAELEAEALGDTSDHVADVGERGVDGGDVGLVAEPAGGSEAAALLVVGEVQLQVTKVLRQGAAGALDGHDASLHGGLDTSGNGDVGGGLDLHD